MRRVSSFLIESSLQAHAWRRFIYWDDSMDLHLVEDVLLVNKWMSFFTTKLIVFLSFVGWFG